MRILSCWIFTSILIGIGLLACNSNQSRQENAANHLVSKDFQVSKTSLDWTGVYKGVLPCTDCEGIRITLILKENKNFERRIQYLGKDGQILTDQGSYEWDKTGSVIALKREGGKNQYYKVIENGLLQLDQEGKPVTDDRGAENKLQKNPKDPKIEGKTWILAEIMGKEIRTGDQPELPFMILDPVFDSMHGNGSCNPFKGSYQLRKNNGITFENVSSSFKNCPDMTVEFAFFEILEKADNYHITNTSMVLMKGRKAPLARFRLKE